MTIRRTPLPSVKTLDAAFPGKGRELRALLAGNLKPEGYSNVRDWLAKCYHRPSEVELLMAAANQVAGTYGVEAIFGSRVSWPDLEYLNTGDTYTLTLAYDRIRERFVVTSWGDWIEAAERRGRYYP